MLVKHTVFDCCLFTLRKFLQLKKQIEKRAIVLARTAEEQLQYEINTFLGWAIFSLKKIKKNDGYLKELLEKLHHPRKKGGQQCTSHSLLYDLINRGGMVQPYPCMLDFGKFIIKHVLTYVLFDGLHTYVIDDAKKNLLDNQEYKNVFSSCYNALSEKHDVLTYENDPIRICEELAKKIFNARVNVIMQAWNDKHTSRNANKFNGSSLREFLK